MTKKLSKIAILIFLHICMICVICVPCVFASTVTVDTYTALRDAIIDSVTSTINLSGPINAGSAETFALGTQTADSLVINGGSSYSLTARNSQGIIVGNTQELTINSFTNISKFQSDQGGFIKSSGTVSLLNSKFSENKNDSSLVSAGGAIYSTGVLYVSNSGFELNANSVTGSGNAYGGAIYAEGTLNVDNSTFSRNSASANDSKGGAIYTKAANTKISNSTFEINFINNTNSAYGGAIYAVNDLIIENSTFSRNYVQSASVNAGAIYAEANLDIVADNGTSVFSANYKSSDNGTTIVYEAVYMSNPASVLALTAKNSGIINFYDEINGANGYSVNIGGTSNGVVNLYNAIKNANITLENITLNLLTGTNAASIQSTANLSSSSLNANSGIISVQDSSIKSLDIGKLTSNSNVSYLIDVVFSGGTLRSDSFNLSSGSSGVVTLSSIGSITVDTFGKTGTVGYNLINNTYTSKVLNNATSSIQLALADSLVSSFDKNITVADYLSSSKYVLKSTDFVGKIGIYVNSAGDSIVFGMKDRADTLAAVNQFNSPGAKEKNFNIAASTTYSVRDNTGATNQSGLMAVVGASGAVIDYVGNYSGFVVPNGANLSITNVAIKNALSNYSGAVISNNGSVSISGSNFTNNKSIGAGLSGGAIYNNGTMTIQNTSFSGNYSIGANNRGGAIYSVSDLTIKSTGSSTVTFSGNYVADSNSSSKTYEAIYMGSGSTLTLNALSGGKIVFNDIISGADSYNLVLSSDSNSSVRFNNAVQNAKISFSDGELILGSGTDGGGSNIIANFSGSEFTATSGKVNMHDSKTSSYNLGKINSSSAVKYDIDMKLSSGSILSDSITAQSGSTGTITINSISGVTISDVINNVDLSYLATHPIVVSVLNRAVATDNIKLALSSNITSSSDFSKEYSVADLYNSGSQRYIVPSTSVLGTFSFYLNDSKDAVVVGLVGSSDALYLTNIFAPSSTPKKDRYFTVANNTTYTVKHDSGVTSKVGNMYVQGSSKTTSVIDYKDEDLNRYSGFDVQSGAVIELSNLTIKNALSTSNGGVINNSGTVGTSTSSGISNVLFKENQAVNGGAIYNTSSINRISGTTFENNIATSLNSNASGGAIYNSGTVRLITNSSFTGNRVIADNTLSNAYGGAIYNSGTMTVSASFTDNYAVGKNAYGGAIYSTGAITLLADNNNYEIRGNYSQSSGGGKVYNAIYMNSSVIEKGLTIQTAANGTYSIYDSIDGGQGYYVTITSQDGSGAVNLYNQISNANVKINNTTLNLSGDSAYTNYVFYTLATTDTTGTSGQPKAKLSLDMSLSARKTDTIKITSNSNVSSGYLTISNIVGITSADITDTNITLQVLNRERNNTIRIVLDSALEESLKRTIGLSNYYDSATNSYRVTPDSYLGGVGVTVNSAGDSLVFGRLAALDPLAQINQFNSSGKNRYFIMNSATATHTTSANTGTTYATGTMFVQGTASGNNISTINYNNNFKGFTVGGSGKLSISNIKFTGAKSTTSGAVISTQGQLTLSNVIFDTNSVTSTGTNITGGILYNSANQSDITAKFINNTVTTTNRTISGAALYSSATVNNIGGSYESNKGITSGAIGYGGAVYLTTDSTVYNVVSNFESNTLQSSNSSVYGGALYNAGIIGKYSGGTYQSGELAATFKNNKVLAENNSSAKAYGGALYNTSTIHTINSLFDSNYASNLIGEAFGGAIYVASGSIAEIKNIIKNNYAYAENTLGVTKGGAMYTAGNIDSITAEFSGNYSYSISANAFGGAIENVGTITNLGGRYISNYAQTDEGDNASGGAVSNSKTITNITGEFDSNTAHSVRGNATGGAIVNNQNSYINSITGTFENNSALSDNSTARGGAIANAAGATIRSIKTDFMSNYAQGKITAQGGAIFNPGTIETISGSFKNNYAIGNSDAHGGAIYTTSNLVFVSSTNENYEISGNYISVDGGVTKEYEAIYVASPQKEIRFLLDNGGSYLVNDNISGSDVYNLVLATGSYGYISLFGEMKKANTTLSNVTLTFGVKTFADSNTTLNADNGSIVLSNDGIQNYEINKLVSSANVKYSINLDTNTKKIDTFSVKRGSNGTVKIDSINVDGELSKGTYQIIKYVGDMTTVSDRVHIAIGNLNEGSQLLKAIMYYGDTISTGYVYRVATTEYTNDSINIDYQDANDVLAALNTFETADERHYKFKASNNTYQVAKNLGETTNQSALYIDGGIDGVLQNILLSNSSSGQRFSGFVLRDGTNLFIHGVNFYGAQSTAGSVINASSSDSSNKSNVTIYSAAFDQNAAGMSGGAIYIGENAQLLFTNKDNANSSVSFTRNSAVTSGGALYNSGVLDINTNSVTMSNNTAGSNGGAIYNESTININAITSNYKSNFASNGGAIYNSNDGVITIGRPDSTQFMTLNFTDNGKSGTNYATRGGAIYNSGIFTALAYANITFSGNYAQQGGAIYNSNTIELQGNTTLTGNYALGSGDNIFGGAIYNTGTLLLNTKNWESDSVPAADLRTVTISQNKSNGNGGAIYTNNKTSIYRANFSSNTSTSGSGGAIYSSAKTYSSEGKTYQGLRVSRSSFSGNTAGLYGGAVYIDNNGSFYSNSTSYTNNTAQKGGAIYLSDNVSASIYKFLYTTSALSASTSAYNYLDNFENSSHSLYGTSVSNNKSTQGVGGALYLSEGVTTTLYGNRFISNSATSTTENAKGGAIYVNSGASIVNPVSQSGYSSPLFLTSIKSNTLTATSGDALGGALYNEGTVTNLFGGIYNAARINSNKAVSTSGDAKGGGIYNIGTFNTASSSSTTNYYYSEQMNGNYAQSSTGAALGGAIYNENVGGSASGKFGHINGTFDSNYALSSNNYSAGGVIYNAANSSIDGLRVLLYQNYASGKSSTASMGGAIYNEGTLGILDMIYGTRTVTRGSSSVSVGYPSYNYVKDTLGSAYGGLLYNTGSITKIFGSSGSSSSYIYTYIYSNYASGAVNAYGGAIYNTGFIPVIQAYFYDNYATTSGSGDAKGGALYNTGTISSITFWSGNTNSGYNANRAISTNGNAYGGAIYNEGTLSTVTNGYATNNRAVSANKAAYGGFIYNTGSAMTIYGGMTGNYASGKTGAQGGAIYSTKDVNLIANGTYIRSIKGNYTQVNGGSKVYEAVYMADADTTLKIDAKDSSIWQIYDILNGANGYNLTLTGSTTSNIRFIGDNAQIKNANVTFNTTNLTLARNTFADSNVVFNANSGKLYLTDGTTYTYLINKLVSNASVKYNIDMNLTSGGSTDVIKLTDTSSSGTITIDNINFIDATEGSYTMRVLNTSGTGVTLALGDNLTKDSGITSPIVFWYEKITQARYTMALAKSNSALIYYDSIKVDVNNPSNSDTLALLNQFAGASSAKHFVFETTSDIYKANSDTGLTSNTQTMTVDGTGSETITKTHPTIDYQGNYSGFALTNSLDTTGLTLKTVNIRNAVTDLNGAVVNASGTANSNLTMNYSSAYKNVSGNYGGAIYTANKGYISLTYDIFAQNKAKQGGAIYNSSSRNASSGSYLLFFNNTIQYI